ncbi:MAG: hypothetical protein EAZ91_10335 [Cytophagales bacterium]|nr:MAG: hypothetical protein EAZ91_10335 [Cytophagales bacterium]
MHKRFTHLYLPFCCFLLIIRSYSIAVAQQQVPPCGFDQNQLKKLATDSSYRAFSERTKPLTNKAVVDTTTLITIPVVFVVYHLGEPVGVGSNVSDADLQNQISLMNKMFAGTKPTYGGVDTRIRFTLARRTTTCTPFNGVARVDARSVANYQSSGVDVGDWRMTNRLRALLPEYQNSSAERFVVVRVVHRVTGAGAWASFGGDIVIPGTTLQSTNSYNTTLSHEMGHVLFLGHTFDGYSYNNTTGQYGCPPNADPENDGDRVADTDPHKIWEPNDVCSPSSEAQINSCTGRPFGLIGRNFMSYGCNLNIFTAGQRYRMRSYLADGLRGLATSIYATAPDAGQSLVSVGCSTSIVSATTNAGEGITQVHFQGIRKISSDLVAANGHYQDYTCQERTTVTAGQSYSLTIKAYGNYQKAYIDYNNDGIFQESTELVWPNAAQNGLITIPNTAVMDRYLRMRVVSDNGTTQPTACYLPGSRYGSGEIEDYAVRILPADTPQSLSLGELASPYLCRGQQTTVPIITNGTFPADNVFYVQLSDPTGSFANPVTVGSGTRSPISVTLPANSSLGEEYQLRVVATNPALTSNSSPMLAIENPASISFTSGSTTVATGQPASISLAISGRLPIGFVVQRNGQDWWYGGLSRRTETLTFTPTSTAIYTLSRVQNGCGDGSGLGSVTIVAPCTTPTSLTESGQTSTGFSAYWATPVGNVLLQWKEAGAATWNQQSLQNNSSWFIGNLSLGKTYVWRVRAVCVDGESEWSAERTVTLTCPVPSQLAELLSPTAARLRWNYQGSGVTYSLQWRPVGTTNWSTVAISTGNSFYMLTGLSNANSYEWRVRSECPDGSVSDYSASRTFTPQCGAPESNGYGTSSISEVRVLWTELPGNRYQVRWRALGNPTWTELDTTTSLTYARFTNLVTDATYEYQVRSVCSASATSAYSPAYTFAARCFQPYVYLSTIALNSASIYWSNIPGQRHDLRWRAVGAANWTDVQSLTVSSYRINDLTTGTNYEAQVRSICSETIVTAYSSSLTFTPSCSIPTSNNMWVSRTGPSSVQVSYAVEAGVSYAVQWRPVGTTAWLSSATITAASTTNGYNSTISGLTNNTDYEWRVVSFCPGGTSATSGIRQFRTSCVTPYSSGHSVGSTFAWVYIGGASSPVQVRWRAVGTTTWTESSVFNSTSYQITGLTSDIAYEWQARSICSATESSPYSLASQFTPRCVAPSTSSMYVTNLLSRSAGLYWSNNNVPVDLRWRAVGAADWTAVSSLTTTTYSLTGLTTGTAYEWQLRSICSATATSVYVAGPTFTPTCALATNLSEYFISPRSAQFRWNAGSGQQYVVQWRLVGQASWTNSSTVVAYGTGNFNNNLTTGLTAGSTYEWQVLTNCEGTLTASSSRTFVTQCTIPVVRSAYNVSSRGAAVYWDAYSFASGVAYRVRYRPTGTTTWVESTTTGNNSIVLTGLTNSTTYEWQVQTICDGTPTGYSPNGTNFTTSCPTPYLYEANVSDLGARLSYYYYPGESMDIRYRVSGTTAWTTVAGVTSGNYSLTGLTPLTAYEWQVQINCDGGQVNTTSTGTFTTIAGCDPNEPNNSTATATVIPTNATSYSTGALCLNLTSDNDWFRWDINGQTYYILVYPFGYGTTGPYSLTMSFANNTLKVNTRAVNGAPTDTYMHLYAANGTTLLAENDDSNNSLFSEITYSLPSSCREMVTVKHGLWTDPTVWSCGRVPVVTDAVQVLHEVSIPSANVGRALRITYGNGGKVSIDTGARLVLGQ